ncbi:MAG: hypothetical protein ACE5G7_00695 [Candidatus Hydrothermarchaeaceae archaeon]
MKLDKIAEDRRVRILAVCLVVALLLIYIKGIPKGLDLQGGSLLQIQTERPLTPSEKDQVVIIMDQRLRGGLGVRDISVQPWGDEFIVIKIAGVSPEEAEKLLGKPGKLVVRIGNITAFTGDELVRVEPISTERGGWGVPFTISEKAAARFMEAAVATNFEEVNMYLDEGALIAVTTERELDEGVVADIGFEGRGKLTKEPDSLTGYTAVVALDVSIEDLGERGREKILEVLEEYGIKDLSFERSGLVNAAPISEGLRAELTAGQVVRGLVLETGSGEDGRLEAKRIEAILRSGALPIKVEVVGSYGISPGLGADFSRSAIRAGLLAFIGVATIVYLRYRNPIFVLPILATGASEIILILGVASLINWEIDLPAIAGIIAAVGTGVDNQIVILDEILLEKERSVRYRIKSAFFIVMGSYFTIIAAMVPLFIITLGMLKGFAVTTIIGATAGVFITRPAFAKIVEYQLK